MHCPVLPTFPRLQDVVKCNIQTDPQKYKGIKSGFSVLLKEQGAAGLFRGWLPTLLGY
jgi:solute carrier family 25 phosphate transporter 3